MTSTVPSALIDPRIWLGDVLPTTRLSATQLALPCWSNVRLVLLPRLKLCHDRTALLWVCLILTLTWPLASALWVGCEAPSHVRKPVASCAAGNGLATGISPPGAMPFGTEPGALRTAALAAFCAARIACSACTVWFNLFW